MKNPFSKDRYEYISTHLYFLPLGLIEKLEDSKPSYVIGSRGSGKTTLLKALNWQERIENKWLNKELGGDAFSGRFIGTYTKLPLIQITSMKAWLEACEDAAHFSLFGYYMDLIASENLAFAMKRLFSDLHLKVTPDVEEKFVKEFLDDHDFLLPPDAKQFSFIADCHKLFRENRRELERFARSRKSVDVCLESMTLPTPGQISNGFGLQVSKMLGESAVTSDEDSWHFKCCFDEAECLDKRQRIALNTIIRTSNSPLSYVVSFVGQPNDLSLTQHENLTVQKADRNLLHLDALSRPQFERLCDGVANIRISAGLSKQDLPDLQNAFSTSSVLGKLNLNQIIAELVKTSEGQAAKDLTKLATDFEDSAWINNRNPGEALPYVESYLSDRLNLSPPTSKLPSDKREQASREFRKKFVASYLSICSELGTKKIPYAFANMVFGLSDNCIRDYLSNMYHIFELAKLEVHEFSTTTIGWEVQSSALHEASREKLESIGTGEDVSNPERVRRLTIALGELTGLVQKGKSNVTHLKSPERGIFHFGEALLSESGSNSSDRELHQIFRDASEAGFFRIKRDGENILGFRVHASLAPSFGFSYRSPQYQIPIKKSDLTSILKTSDDDELKKIAARIAARIGKTRDDPDQLKLFELAPNEGFIVDDHDNL